MNDDVLEATIRTSLYAHAPTDVPVRLEDRVRQIPELVDPKRQRRSKFGPTWARAVAIVAAIVLLVGTLLVVPRVVSGPGSMPPNPFNVDSTPSASITFACPPAPIYCSDVIKRAVLTAVAGLGYPVKTVTIGVFGFSCGVPPAVGTAPPCPALSIPPTAYVSFVGTDKIARVTVGTWPGGPGIDSVVSFEVPPAPDASF